MRAIHVYAAPRAGVYEAGVTRADRIWSPARLKAIVALNRGRYDRLIDRS